MQIKVRKVCHACVPASVCKLISSYIKPSFLDIRRLVGNVREKKNQCHENQRKHMGDGRGWVVQD